jgi:hypothetical protein
MARSDPNLAPGQARARHAAVAAVGVAAVPMQLGS